MNKLAAAAAFAACTLLAPFVFAQDNAAAIAELEAQEA